MSSPKKKKPRRRTQELSIPSEHDWRTTDEDELNRRRIRARNESFSITNLNAAHRIFSNYRVLSGSGMTYEVEIRDLGERRFACACVDFRANGLGSCKHVEAILLNLQRRFPRLFKAALKASSNRADIELDRKSNTLCLKLNEGKVSPGIRRLFDAAGNLIGDAPEPALTAIQRSIRRGANVRISQEIAPWLEHRRRATERKRLRREYEQRVQSGEWPAQETTVPLFPYQRDGMLHLAFNERALLADEMGLGKTIQAIAACALLHRLGNANRVLVVTPASLKSEWEEQIEKFTRLPHWIVYGPRRKRLKEYAAPAFFTIVNYEQMLVDSLDVNERLRPDVVILDEAQRIKNWNTKTAQAIKRLKSRYAFVLTGTPIENRIDELHSLMDFLNPEALGPLFRFNRDFYELDERGRPEGFRNLDILHQRVAPYMVRRRKSDVESELPERTDHTRFVQMTDKQWEHYKDHELVAAKLLRAARQRPLRKVELDILQTKLAMMRMICDTNFILDREDKTCPKLKEIERIVEDALENGAKVIVFSEWERMLQLVRELCRQLGVGHAWHTGSVPQKKRRGEINAFKSDPDCRVFLSTDSGSTGLNLQNASVVVNCDLPWNPAKLEQRIARAWRKNQTNAVTVYNLVSEDTIEHKMLETLANKQALADGVLDQLGDITKIKLRGGRQAFLDKLQQLVSATPVNPPDEPAKKQFPADRPLAFGSQLHDAINGDLIRCDERYPTEGDHTVLLVVVENAARHQPRIQTLHDELFGGDQTELLSPVKLEVIDRPTADALERLEAAGLIAPTFRSSRPLFPAPDAGSTPAPLSKDERTRIADAREQSARKLKMATVLSEADLLEEARSPLIEAIISWGKAIAIENRLPEPESAKEALSPPIARHWGDSLSEIQSFERDEELPVKSALPAFSRLTSCA